MDYKNMTNEEFIAKTLYSMERAFLQIRFNAYHSKENVNALENIKTISDAFHNVPKLLQEKELDREQIISEISMAGKEYLDFIIK